MKAKFIKPKMIRILNSLSIDMVEIPQGEFFYKENNNKKTYKIDYDIEVGKYPITVKEFEHFIKNTGYLTEAEKGKGSYVWQKNGVLELQSDANWKNPYFEQTDNNPVVCLTIKDIKEYISWLNKKTSKFYRLPTEDEWEYVAFAMNKHPFGLNKSNKLEDFAWFYDNSNANTHPVGNKFSNKWGIHDMLGNVWEWCEPEALKGGSWGSVKRRMNILSKADRHNIHSDNKMGFRLVCSNNRVKLYNENSTIESNRISKKISVDDRIKKVINKHQKIEQNVIAVLKNLGWNDVNILKEDIKSNRYVDIVLAIDGIEITIIEIKVNIDIGRNEKRYIQQLHKYAKQHNVDFAYITNGKKIYEYSVKSTLYKKVKNFPSKTQALKNLLKTNKSSNLVTYECSECYDINAFSCNKLEWYKRSNENANEYQAFFEDTCSKCNNIIEVILTCWEYPIGAEDTRDIEAKGAKIIQGDCCPDFHNDYGEEPTENDEYSNLKRDAEIKQIEEEELRKREIEASVSNQKVFEVEEWLLKRYKNPNALPITFGEIELYYIKDILQEHFSDENKEIINEAIAYINKKYKNIQWEMQEQFLFDKINQRIDDIEQLVSSLIPYAELEYTSDYDREDYLDLDKYPEPIYLISKDFDQHYLYDIIEEIQEDIDELQSIAREKDFENREYIESLIEKKYRVTYSHIDERLGIDVDCRVQEEYDNKYDECIIYIEPENEWNDQIEDILDEEEAQYTICQMLGTSYFIKIILSEKDKKKMSGGYAYIDIRDYGIDNYLRDPDKEITTSYDEERFKNILINTEKKNWEIQLNCSGMEPQKSIGFSYLTSNIFKPISVEQAEKDASVNGDMHKEVSISSSNTKIYVPANGRVYKFEVNDAYYDIEIRKILEKTINESQVTREMVNVTGATHQGTIKFKNNIKGNIEELNRLIDEQFDKERGLAFYSIDTTKDNQTYVKKDM